MARSVITILIYFLCPIVYAASLSDSILHIPKGAVFELRHELEIPANQNFMLLGKNRLQDTFNELNQTYNDNEGRFKPRQYGYYHYDAYLTRWQRTAGEAYHACLERHRVYYRRGGDGDSRNTIINQGRNNTNIIINNSNPTPPSVGSYISDNNCIMPEHTIALLLLNKKEAGAGGIFREGHRFKLRDVNFRRRGDFYILTLKLDHKVARAIHIVTTESPKNIRIEQLQSHDPGDSFFSNLGYALNSLVDIGGDYFSIHLPEKQYYD